MNLKRHQILDDSLDKDEIYEHTFPWLGEDGFPKEVKFALKILFFVTDHPEAKMISNLNYYYVRFLLF